MRRSEKKMCQRERERERQEREKEERNRKGEKANLEPEFNLEVGEN